MSFRYDDAVVGAGILGLAHAYHLARRGRRVVVFERNSAARGASIRNFGMIWPIGQPAGPLRTLALRSLEGWRTVIQEAGLWFAALGSMHLAYHEDEAALLREFAAASDMPVSILTPDQVLEKSPAVREEGLISGLWSPSEIGIDPRGVIATLPDWLSRTFDVAFHFNRTVIGFDGSRVHAGGHPVSARRLWICSGDDLQTLYPEVLQALGLVRCKLQMMRSKPSTGRIGPLLAAGLTLRHYPAFADCPSLPALKRRIAEQSPEYDRFGIHVLVAQNGKGELVIGDSHEYGDSIEPFDKPLIDELIIHYLRGFLAVPDMEISARWHGIYVKHPSASYTVVHPTDNVIAVTGVGGNGMTLSFGLAEKVVCETLGEG